MRNSFKGISSPFLRQLQSALNPLLTIAGTHGNRYGRKRDFRKQMLYKPASYNSEIEQKAEYGLYLLPTERLSWFIAPFHDLIFCFNNASSYHTGLKMAQNPQPPFLSRLPVELKEDILKTLDVGDLTRLSSASRSLRADASLISRKFAIISTDHAVFNNTSHLFRDGFLAGQVSISEFFSRVRRNDAPLMTRK